MTPGARAAAAIGVLDRHLAGEAVERALTNWGRSSRFAGSGDRAAVRDLVFDALRCKRSFAALGGAATGRGLILGGLRAVGTDPGDIFTGEGHAPAKVGPDEGGRQPVGAEVIDVADWLLPVLEASLDDVTVPVLQAMQSRAPVFLRVNLRKASVPQALARLAGEEIAAQPHPLAKTALEVTEGARKIQTSECFRSGIVELQDASSQAVVEALPLRDGMRVLDHCAGGGGKTLAMAARARMKIWAHDSNPRRMADLPERARRAGVVVTLTEAPEAVAPFDLVLVDAPCSGSGSWRRDPEGKWALNAARLADLITVQAAILRRAAEMVAPSGTLAYATCSLLTPENDAQVDAFVQANPRWSVQMRQQFLPTSGGDGFFVALLTRA